MNLFYRVIIAKKESFHPLYWFVCSSGRLTGLWLGGLADWLVELGWWLVWLGVWFVHKLLMGFNFSAHSTAHTVSYQNNGTLLYVPYGVPSNKFIFTFGLCHLPASAFK